VLSRCKEYEHKEFRLREGGFRRLMVNGSKVSLSFSLSLSPPNLESKIPITSLIRVKQIPLRHCQELESNRFGIIGEDLQMTSHPKASVQSRPSERGN
jgi:hypothetical protein